MAKDPKLVRGRTAAPAQNDPADLEKMKTGLGVDMAKDPSLTAAQGFDGARMGLAPKVVAVHDPPIPTPFGVREQKSVVEGKSVLVRGDPGGRRMIKKKKK